MKQILALLSIFFLLAVPVVPQGRVAGEVIMTRGITESTGHIFFVYTGTNRTTGSDEGAADGSVNTPFATLDFAVGRCGTSPAAASTGCHIYAMPGHAETFSTDNSLVIDVAGISMIGLGSGDLRPQITLATSTAAQVGIAAANVEFANFHIVGNIASNVAYLTVSGAGDGAHIHHNIFREGTGSGLIFIDVEGVANDVLINNNKFYAQSSSGTFTYGIDVGAAALRMTIRDNEIFGEYDTGAIGNSTGAMLDLDISNNYLQNETAGALALNLDGASLGILRDNILATDDFDTALDPGSAATVGNIWVSNVIDGSDGIPISGGGGTPVQAPVRFSGDTYWVNDNGGSDATGSGRSPDNPFATLDFAFTATSGVTADNGDVIYLMADHIENLAGSGGASVNWDIDGVSVVGLGTGDQRPTFTFITDIAAEIQVTATGGYLENVVLLANIESTAMIALDATATGFHINNIEMREGSATPVLMIDMTTAANDVIIENSTFLCPTATNCDSAISLSATTPARFTLRNNFIRGDWDLGALQGSGAGTDYNIHNNSFTNLLTGVAAVDLSAAALGRFHDNRLATDLIATSLNPGSLGTAGNLWTDLVGTDGRAKPIPEYSTYVEGYGYLVEKISADMEDDPDNLFTVTGIVMITFLMGEITTAFSVSADIHLETDGSVVMHSVSPLDSLADGVLWIHQGDPGAVINGADVPVVGVGHTASAPQSPIVVGGRGDTIVIRNNPGTADTGTFNMYLFYIPISPGATVVAAT